MNLLQSRDLVRMEDELALFADHLARLVPEDLGDALRRINNNCLKNVSS